nr:hypothetical protein [uncultured bacterium]
MLAKAYPLLLELDTLNGAVISVLSPPLNPPPWMNTMSGNGPLPSGTSRSSLLRLRAELYATFLRLREVMLHAPPEAVAELLDEAAATELLDGWLLELAATELLLD